MKNKSRRQYIFSLFLLLVVTAVGIFCVLKGSSLIWYWVLGLALGYVLERSGICFNAMANEPMIVGSTAQFRAILIGVLVSSLGVSAIKYLSGGMLDFLGVSTISIPLMLGAFLFGMGMILAGCCTSGMFVRMAEGFSVHAVTLVCVVIGYLFANSHYQTVWAPFVVNAPMVYLPTTFGWFFGLLIHIGIILLLYTAAVKWEKKKLSQ